MKFICNQNILAQAINIVIKACATRSTNPLLECILITATNTTLTLMGNNLEMGIEKTIEGEILENGKIAIDAKLFSEIIKKMPQGDIKMATINETQITITSGKSRFTLQTLDTSHFPTLPDVSLKQSLTISQLELKNLIKQTIFSVAQEESRPTLTGEKFEVENGQLSLVAIDGFRIAFRTISLNNKNLRIEKVIPAKTLMEITKILSNENNDEVTICFGENHILFNLIDTTIVSRLLEGEFLRYKDIFSNDFETKIIVNRNEFLMSIERSALMSKEGGKNPIRFNITQDTLIITSNTDIGNSLEEIDIILTGMPLKIAFNPRYLIDALKNIEDDEICINFLSKTAPAVIMPINSDKYRYLVLPIRVND